MEIVYDAFLSIEFCITRKIKWITLEQETRKKISNSETSHEFSLLIRFWSVFLPFLFFFAVDKMQQQNWNENSIRRILAFSCIKETSLVIAQQTTNMRKFVFILYKFCRHILIQHKLYKTICAITTTHIISIPFLYFSCSLCDVHCVLAFGMHLRFRVISTSYRVHGIRTLLNVQVHIEWTIASHCMRFITSYTICPYEDDEKNNTITIP